MKTKAPVWLVAIAGVFLVASAALAENDGQRYGEEYQTCNTGQTKSIVECVDALTRKWDARLNAVYDRALKKLPPSRRDALKSVQRAWLQFRDANCRWYSAGEGTIARVEAVECMRSMTAARALELEEAIEER